MMRAILVKGGSGPVENLYLGEADKPSPGPGGVLVKIRAFGMNRMDLMQRQGGYPLPPSWPSIMGVEFSGHVVEVGDGVTEWKEGDEVLGLACGGAYAEFIVAPHGNLLRKPGHLSWEEAASIPEVFFTAFQALVELAGVKKGDNVLVHAGASGVGLAAIQLARFYGAATVTATASTSEKLDWLLSIPSGATHAVNYKTQDFAAEVKRITDGKGADVVIDFVGQSHWHKNIDALAFDGRMTILALLSGAEVQSFNLMPLVYKRVRIQGSTLRVRTDNYQAQLVERFKKEVFDNITGSSSDGPIRTYIHKVYPWQEIQEAHREMAADKNIGKIVVQVV